MYVSQSMPLVACCVHVCPVNCRRFNPVDSDAPFRFYDAVIAGLAYRIASKRRESMGLVPQLKAVYDEALLLAQDEDRDRSSLLICPYITQSF